mmetsp:Transcript_28245/g.87388  ORF Transcript_28245/g.87388 Transcript_28245/m.87388 type:complete len:218 (-) Transcript_28245:24-677(-)
MRLHRRRDGCGTPQLVTEGPCCVLNRFLAVRRAHESGSLASATLPAATSAAARIPAHTARQAMSTVTVQTSLGLIKMKLRPDAAPHTVQHFCKLAPLFDGCCFYRSDFVIQGGLQRPDGSAVDNPLKPIPMNETKQGPMISNTRGTAAFGHWDVPDAGNSDWFINIKANPHLDDAYGGYCVFAAVDPADSASFRTIDAIAAAIPRGERPEISYVTVE